MSAGRRGRSRVVVRIIDVARMAGVGVATVSRVLNDHPYVSPDTRSRVQAAIDELGYHPSGAARALSSGRSTVVLIVVNALDGEPVFDRLRGALDVMSDTDFDPVVAMVGTPEELDRLVVERSSHDQAAGILLIDVGLNPEHVALLAEAGVPIVALGTRVLDVPSVLVDNFVGGRMATQHLIELGHERIGFIGDESAIDVRSPASSDHHAGFVTAMDSHGLSRDPKLIALGPRTPESTTSMTEALLDLEPPPTAIVADSRQHALGVLHATHAVGVRVPEELSIVGFQDGEAEWYAGLTTVREPLLESGIRAGRLLLSLIAEEVAPENLPELDLELVVRNTTAPPPRSPGDQAY
jgi:DNA-binding LacI/PurR family transcriptional regulator